MEQELEDPRTIILENIGRSTEGLENVSNDHNDHSYCKQLNSSHGSDRHYENGPVAVANDHQENHDMHYSTTNVVVGSNAYDQQQVQKSRDEHYYREPFQKSTMIKIHEAMARQRVYQDTFEGNAFDHQANNQSIENSLDVYDRYVPNYHQPLPTNTDIGSSDDLDISESLTQDDVEYSYNNDEYNPEPIQDYHHGYANDHYQSHQPHQSSTNYMYNQQPYLSNSDTDDSNDPYTNQPHSSNGQPINPYRQRSFQNGAGFNGNNQRRKPVHSVDSILKKTNRRKHNHSADEMASNKQIEIETDMEKINEAYIRSRGFYDTQSTSSSDSQASSSSSNSEISEYYEARLAVPLAKGAALDTKTLCRDILQELEAKKIPQTIFANRVINRSQGTLSEIIRKPKPWGSLKSGRNIYVRLFNWFQLPVDQRMEIVDKKINWPVPEKKQNTRKRKRTTEGSPKKPRTEFHPATKNALKRIYDENPKPSNEMLGIIADSLKLDKGSVTNFFQNTRRRTKYQKECNNHPVNQYSEDEYEEDQQQEEQEDYY
ncbi:unnamed protein product [Caenorhabditis nigoni]